MITNAKLIEALMKLPLDAPVERIGDYAPEISDFTRTDVEGAHYDAENGVIVIE